jgi:hypothetical protein
MGCGLKVHMMEEYTCISLMETICILGLEDVYIDPKSPTPLSLPIYGKGFGRGGN